jgi:hypothetical protein
MKITDDGPSTLRRKVGKHLSTRNHMKEENNCF